MKEVTNISVIIPIHKLDDNTKPLFENAVKSVRIQFITPDELLIVVPSGTETEEYLKSFDFSGIKTRIISNSGETDFASQMNLGVEECTTEWFSLLEFDDEFSKIWMKNVVEYKSLYTDVNMFLPIVVDVDIDGNFIGLTNEAVWASEFSDEMGILDNTSLLAYQNFNFDGMVMKKEIYQELGGIKPSMKLTFIYEFLLRATFFNGKIMIIPKFGYKHINQREGSLFFEYRNKDSESVLASDEARWWMSLAKKEYFHKNDRNIIYEVK